MIKHELEKYYTSDENWSKLVEFHKQKWNECNFKTELLSLLKNDIEIAQVIFGLLENDSLNWIYNKVTALDNLSPIECLNEEKKLKRLKVVLMRFPC